MLEMIDIGVENAVAYRLAGKITEEEMTSALDIFRDKIDKGEKLLVYQEVESIGGAEFDAMVEKFKFLFDFFIISFIILFDHTSMSKSEGVTSGTLYIISRG